MRATSGTAVQQTNCHPFRHGHWLFVHNGVVAGFHQMRRELMLAVDPDLFADFQGSTDSEVIFRLALTFGLEQDPIGALEHSLGLVEETARKHGIENALQTSMGLSDGETLWAFRYSTEGKSRTLFTSTDAHSLRASAPRQPALEAPARRRSPGRLRAGRRPPGRVRGDPGVQRPDRPVRRARGAPVPPARPRHRIKGPGPVTLR